MIEDPLGSDWTWPPVKGAVVVGAPRTPSAGRLGEEIRRRASARALEVPPLVTWPVEATSYLRFARRIHDLQPGLVFLVGPLILSSGVWERLSERQGLLGVPVWAVSGRAGPHRLTMSEHL